MYFRLLQSNVCRDCVSQGWDKKRYSVIYLLIVSIRYIQYHAMSDSLCIFLYWNMSTPITSKAHCQCSGVRTLMNWERKLAYRYSVEKQCTAHSMRYTTFLCLLSFTWLHLGFKLVPHLLRLHSMLFKCLLWEMERLCQHLHGAWLLKALQNKVRMIF